MTREQEQALASLTKATERFQAAYAEMLLAAQEMDLAMSDCRQANDVRRLVTA